MEDFVFESVQTATPEAFTRFVEARERAGDVHDYELLNGRIVVTPPAGWPHGQIEVEVCVLLEKHARELGLGEVFGPSQGFELPSGDVVGPDASFVSAARWRAAAPPEEGKFLTVVPDLAVEILSPSTASRDRGEKRAIYERNGVAEYWLVDPRARTVTRFVLKEGRHDGGAVFDDQASVVSEVLPDLAFPVAALWPRR